MRKPNDSEDHQESPDSRTNLEDYARIADALAFLVDRVSDQPSLAEVAAHVGLSEFHFQRLFRRWAGISPKRFLQYLTTQHTQELIQQSPTLLDAAYSAGLSGPGRLHDLYVSVLGMTPAQARDGGAGLTLKWSVQPTPFGMALLAKSPQGLSNLEFVDDADIDKAEKLLRERWPAATLVRDDDALAPVCSQLFSGLAQESGGGLVLHVRGTNFQLRVWEALLNLPSGAVLSYEGLAKALDMPKGARAVAGAVARNPVGWLIPCHRVIRSTGVIGEYRWGSVRKRAMLGWEFAAASGDPGNR